VKEEAQKTNYQPSSWLKSNSHSDCQSKTKVLLVNVYHKNVRIII